jgi:hypothetical protein
MIRPRLELDPLSGSPLPALPLLALSLLEPEVAVGVTRMVFWMVTTPAEPVDRVVETEVKGVGVVVGVVETLSGVAVPEFESPVEEGPAVDRAVDVRDAEFPPPDEPPLVAKPVIVAMLGLVDA